VAKVWSALFGRRKEEERLSVNDWAKSFQYDGNLYSLMGASSTYSKKEEPNGTYESYISNIYKKNGIVFACCLVRSQIFSEARLQWQGIKNGRPGDLFGSQELEIFENPWPGATTGEMLCRAIQDTDLEGNFFVVREGRRLRRLRPDWVDIILSAPPAEAVKSDVVGYVYKPGGTESPESWEIFPVGGENGKVAHWAPIPDPECQYRGMSWITPVLREIVSDKAATDHKAAFYNNAATPNIAISFKETVTEEQFKEFMKAVDSGHTGPQNAYKTLYLGGGADVTPLTIDFQALDFKKIQGAGETRIAAAARVHPVVVGLSEGMQGSSLNAGNFQSARDAFADGTMRPLWRSFCAAMESVVKVPKTSRLWYDDRDIAYLKRDAQQLAEIASEEATIMTKLVQDGYTPESITLAVTKGYDWSLLKHTGLFSVQLQPPMPDGPPVKTVGPDGKPIKPATTPTPGAKPATGPGATGRPKAGQQIPGAKPPAQPKAATPKAAPAAPTAKPRGKRNGPAAQEEARSEARPEEGRSEARPQARSQEGRSEARPQEARSEAPEEEVGPDGPAKGDLKR
jgi:phage portal protein BeeE